jgi:PAS domain-containing protein
MFDELSAATQVYRKLWPRLKKFFRVLVEKQPLALLLSLALLLVSLGLGAWYWHRSSIYESIIQDTLWADMEATPQRFKGVEAFIFSNLKQTTSANDSVSEALKIRPLTSGFIKAATNLQAKLDVFVRPYREEKECKAKAEKTEGEAQRVQEKKACEVIMAAAVEKLRREEREGCKNAWKTEEEKKQCEVRLKPAPLNDKILTDAGRKGFLFVPVYLVRPVPAKPEQRKPLSEDEIGRDEFLIRDVELTRYLADELQAFTTESIAELPKNDELKDFISGQPTQVYLVTKNGINRIFNDQLHQPMPYYEKQFPATTFFPSRPYFWPAFENNHSGESFKPQVMRLGEYFHVSRPYMDLGGNGIIITLSRGLVINGVVQAALCFDLKFTSIDGIDKSLESSIAALGGSSVKVTCQMSEQTKAVCPSDDASKDANAGGRAPDAKLDRTQKDLKRNVESYIHDHKIPSQRAEIAGNIQVIKNDAKSNEIQISIPVGETDYKEGEQTTTLLLVSLNLVRYKRVTSLIAAAGGISFGAMIVLLTYFWGRTAHVGRDYEEAFRKVARVMYRSPTPYVRLDANDRICDCSVSFCELLGYPTDEESIKNSMEEIKQKTFESLCADKESRAEYQKVQESRKLGEKVEPYPLRLKHRDGTTIAPVRVRSAVVPSTERGKMPETFGILIEPASSDKPPASSSTKKRPPKGSAGRRGDSAG